MKVRSSLILVIVAWLLLSLTGCNGSGTKEEPIGMYIYFTNGMWYYLEEWDQATNTFTGNVVYGWEFGVMSAIPCTLRLRGEYYNYDTGTLEATTYSDPIEMEGGVVHSASGKYVTNKNIKKMRVIIERIDKGTVQEIDFREYDNIPKKFP